MQDGLQKRPRIGTNYLRLTIRRTPLEGRNERGIDTSDEGVSTHQGVDAGESSGRGGGQGQRGGSDNGPERIVNKHGWGRRY